MTRSALLWILAGVLGLFGGGFWRFSAAGAEKVQLATSYLPHGGNMGYWVALGRGLYKDAGLEVAIGRGYGSLDTIKRVDAKGVDFGEGDAGTLIVARTRGIRVKEVGMIYHDGQYAAYALKSSGIRAPKDMEGRSVGGVSAGATESLFPAFLRRNNVDESKVKFVPMTAAATVPSLLAGNVDIILTFALTGVGIQEKALAQGKDIVEFLYSDHGLPLYSNGIVAHGDSIQGKPDRVRRFVDATLRGYVWAAENPAAAAGIFHKFNPTADKGLAERMWKKTMQFIFTPETKKTGIGIMGHKKMEFTRDIITQYMKLSTKIPVEDIYTNKFVPKGLYPKDLM